MSGAVCPSVSVHVPTMTELRSLPPASGAASDNLLVPGVDEEEQAPSATRKTQGDEATQRTFHSHVLNEKAERATEHDELRKVR